jgi:hypothetical protein
MHLSGWLVIFGLWRLWKKIPKPLAKVSRETILIEDEMPFADPLQVPVSVKMRFAVIIGMWGFGAGALLLGIWGIQNIVDQYWPMFGLAAMGGGVLFTQVIFQRTGYEPILVLSHEGFRYAPLPEVRWRDVFGISVGGWEVDGTARWRMDFGVQGAKELLAQMNPVARWMWRALHYNKILGSDTIIIMVPMWDLDRAAAEVWATAKRLRESVSPRPMKAWSSSWSTDELQAHREAEIVLERMRNHYAELRGSLQVSAREESKENTAILLRYADELERDATTLNQAAERVEKSHQRNLVRSILQICVAIAALVAIIGWEIWSHLGPK